MIAEPEPLDRKLPEITGYGPEHLSIPEYYNTYTNITNDPRPPGRYLAELYFLRDRPVYRNREMTIFYR